MCNNQRLLFSFCPFQTAITSPSSLRQQQEGQVPEGDEPEVCHALPGVQPARGQLGRGRQDPNRGRAGSQSGQEQVQE